MPTLTYTSPGSRSPITTEIYKPITSIGSGKTNDIQVPDPLMAEDHAHIRLNGEHFTISVLSKKNILQVNGRVRKQVTLKHEDKLLLGATECTFRMFSERQPPKNEEETNEVDAYRRVFLFSQKLMREKSLPHLLEHLVDEVIALTKAERGFIILLEGNIPQVAVGRNLKKESLADAATLYSDSIVKKVALEKRPLLLNNALQNEDFNTAVSVINLHLTSVMCVPLLERGKLLGVLYLGNSQISSLFDQGALEVLTVFSAQASLIIQNALLVNELELDNQTLISRIEAMRDGGIIGSCKGIRKLLDKVRKVATTDVSVLIQGETGTGKELFSREIHNQSNRKNGPFVTINCGAIPENLLESELFGHVKGAFTGAIANKIGKFKAADGGTLFLDELGELPLSLQVKLLRSLEEKIITRVGDTRPEPVDIRIVAATNRNLEEEVKQNRFREDLYYRLNVICLQLPPLRERDEDLVLLARYFLQKFTEEYNRPIKGFTAGAIISIRKWSWPGNIRELENRIRKAIILAEGTHIGPEDLDIREDMLEQILPLADAKEQFQIQYINEILALNNGNRTKTARDLGVDPRTIFRHLEKKQDKKE